MNNAKILITPTLFMDVLRQVSSEVFVVKLFDRNDNTITVKITSFQEHIEHIEVVSCQAELLDAIQLLNLVRMNSDKIFSAIDQYKLTSIKNIEARQLSA